MMSDLAGSLVLIEDYGLPLILLLGAIYALYRFMVFSLYEVKNEFGGHHNKAKEDMQEVKILLAEIKSELNHLMRDKRE
jgi:hypothetical protein|tara:strand:+ start:294 stop:530 length:237 start_codon:yes stop_codon:yes gene_type:complete